MLGMRYLLSLVALTVLAQEPPLDNLRVAQLTKSGVSASELSRLVCAAPEASFDLQPASLNSLAQAGVPDQVIRSMAARMNGNCGAAGAVMAVPQTKTTPPAAPPIKRAQPGPDLFAGYSYFDADSGLGATVSASGWESAAALPVFGPLAVEGNVSGYYKTVDGVRGSEYIFAGGPRFSHGALFLHSLFGADHASAATAIIPGVPLSIADNAVAVVLGGGATVKTGKSWGLRFSADYVLTHHAGYSQNNLRLGVGLVCFPHHQF